MLPGWAAAGSDEALDAVLRTVPVIIIQIIVINQRCVAGEQHNDFSL